MSALSGFVQVYGTGSGTECISRKKQGILHAEACLRIYRNTVLRNYEKEKSAENKKRGQKDDSTGYDQTPAGM